MATPKISKSDKLYLEKLGKRVRKLILEDMGFQSLDAFSLQHHDLVTKATLYQICDGKRDMKISTLRGLAKALKTNPEKLIAGL